MAKSKQSLSAKISESYSELTEREKKLVVAMAIVVPLVVLALVVGIFSRSLGDIESQTNSYENALELVAAGGPDFMKRQNTQSGAGGVPSLFTDEVMTDNEVRLTSFVASKATAAGVKVSSYDSEEIPIGSKNDQSGPIIIEKLVKVDIRDAQHKDLLKFLEEIETSGEPVVIKRIDMRGMRRAEPGEVRARVEVATYIKREQKS